MRNLRNRELTGLITKLEQGQPLPSKYYAKTGRAHVVGITGPPGVGKSSLINRLIPELRKQNKTVAVVAVDPTSPVSGGALLGDRLRMQRHSEDRGVFIRSLATRRHQGGVTDSTQAIVHALDAAGFDFVIVETVGAGQDEVEIADIAQTVVVVLMPELGDQIQRAKSGLMEIADLLVVNKTDLATDAREHDITAGETGVATSSKWKRPTIFTSAKTGDGIADLVVTIQGHYRHLISTDELDRRCQRAARAEVIRLLQTRIAASILRTLETSRVQSLLTKVAERKLDPHEAVESLAKFAWRGNKRSFTHATNSQ